MSERREGRNVDDLHERVRRRLEKDHGSLFRQNRGDRVGVFEKTVRTAVEVVAGDNLVTRVKQASDNVKASHARRHDQRAVGIHDLGQVTLEMGTGRVARTSVIVLIALALEGCGLVDRNAASIVLVV
ncbi:cystathionine beta-lyase, partial [Aureobasidium melanogenum]